MPNRFFSSRPRIAGSFSAFPRSPGRDGSAQYGSMAHGRLLDLIPTAVRTSASERRRADTALSIVVVDGSMDERQALLLLGEDHGYLVVHTDRGEETIRLARQQHFDVAIIALMLPDMSGEDLAKRLKCEMDPAPYVIAYTGNYRHREAALAAGCDAFIVKPGVEELLTLLERVAGDVATRHQTTH